MTLISIEFLIERLGVGERSGKENRPFRSHDFSAYLKPNYSSDFILGYNMAANVTRILRNRFSLCGKEEKASTLVGGWDEMP